jgi:hypothetical protein
MTRTRAAVLAHFPTYRSAKQLENDVRGEVQPYGYDEEFESALVADLIERAHYYCASRGLRPQRFRKRPRNGRRTDPAKEYDFEGWFSGEIGWHGVSWTKCIKGRTWESDIEAALRREVQNKVFGRQCDFPTCERCQIAPSVETDHVEPEFQDVVSMALDGLSEDEILSAFAKFDWLNEERFRLPADHVIRVVFLEAHEHAELMAVCRPCHKANAADRKGARTVKPSSSGVRSLTPVASPQRRHRSG